MNRLGVIAMEKKLRQSKHACAGIAKGQFRWTPTALRMRNGLLSLPKRSHSDWIQALAGHVESAHQGNVLKECAGCMELAKKVAETE